MMRLYKEIYLRVFEVELFYCVVFVLFCFSENRQNQMVIKLSALENSNNCYILLSAA